MEDDRNNLPEEPRHNLAEDWEDFAFHLHLSIIYHQKRENFYESVSRWNEFLSLILGSATIASLLGMMDSSVSVGFASAVTILSGLNLVFRVPEKAQLHHDLARRFAELEIKVDMQGDDDVYKSLCKERRTIEMDEPVTKMALYGICYNEAMRAFGYNKGGKDIPCLRKLFRHFF